jgi:hypothetical protein
MWDDGRVISSIIHNFWQRYVFRLKPLKLRHFRTQIYEIRIIKKKQKLKLFKPLRY